MRQRDGEGNVRSILSVPSARVAPVSEQTAQKLQEATAEMAARQLEADSLKHELLAKVAQGMPTRLQDIAKRTAHSQPDVTRQLGSEGISVLRRELVEQAEVIATELTAAADDIKWPTRQSEYSPIITRDIHSALFHYLRGHRTNSLAAIFKRHGFAIQDDNAQRAQSLIHPQQLYNQDDFAEVAAALNAVADAEKAVAAAKAEDDRDTVDALWGD